MPTTDDIQKARADFKSLAAKLQAYSRVAEDRAPHLTKAQAKQLRLLVADSEALIKKAATLIRTEEEVQKAARTRSTDAVRKHGAKPRSKYP